MDQSTVRTQIAAERRELAAMLTELPEETWDEPTLCAGWRVREVVAHMTTPFVTTMPSFVLEMVKARGSFDRVADRFARRHAARPAAHAARLLADNANHPWKPPGGGYAGALAHDVIHGLDITTALGLDRRVPLDRLRTVLEGSTSRRSVRYFGVDLDGIELRADDLNWSYGAGTPVTGAGQDLLLVLSGRKLPEGRLTGAAARFTAP